MDGSSISGITETKPLLKQDSVSYHQHDFNTGKFEIVIANLPAAIKFTQLQQFLSATLKMERFKIKSVGCPPFRAFVIFNNNEDRNQALNILKGYFWNGKYLTAKPLDPAVVPKIAKHKTEDSGESFSAKRNKEDEKSLAARLNDSVTPLWNITYEDQLKEKQQNACDFLRRLEKQIFKVNNNFATLQAGGRKICEMAPIKPSPVTSAYRNKCKFVVGYHLHTKEKTVGFSLDCSKGGCVSVFVAPPDECVNVSEKILKVAKVFESYIRQSDKDVYDPQICSGYWHQLTVRTSRNDDVLLIIIMHSQNLSESELEEEKCKLKHYFNSEACSSFGITSVFFQTLKKTPTGKDTTTSCVHLLGRPHITETLLGMKIQVGPEPFFQVNVMATEILLQVIAEKAGVTESSTVLDICCGTGTIGLFLAKSGAKVVGVEVSSEAVKNANVNAELNGVKNAQFHCGKIKTVLPKVLKTFSESVVAVAGPPRKGLGPKALEAIRDCENIYRLIYVTCNPEMIFKNFVDLCRPTSKKYKRHPFCLVEAIPIDMFPHTTQYEVVLVFDRNVKEIK